VLERVQKRLQRSGSGTVFGVTYKDAPGASRDFVRKEKATWPNVRDDRLKLAPKYGTSQLPETFVIDKTGRVVALSRSPSRPPRRWRPSRAPRSTTSRTRSCATSAASR
jgi:cytochrome c biogenesis protein CcmG/thiol:disulfide interchange protein DsbE